MSIIKNGKKSVIALAITVMLTACGGDDTSSNLGDGNQVTGDSAQADEVSVQVSEGSVSGAHEASGEFLVSFADTDMLGKYFSNEAVNDIKDYINWYIYTLNEVVSIPVEVPVKFRSCGIANAYYRPTPEIVMCWELLDSFFFKAYGALGNYTWASNRSRNAFEFVLLHEVGHALHWQLNLPLTGNAESNADAFASVMADYGSVSVIGYSAGQLLLLEDDTPFGDEHPDGGDRASDIICWAMGADESLRSLSPEMADGYDIMGRDCVAEFASQKHAVEILLGDYLKPLSKTRKTSRHMHSTF